MCKDEERHWESNEEECIRHSCEELAKKNRNNLDRLNKQKFDQEVRQNFKKTMIKIKKG